MAGNRTVSFSLFYQDHLFPKPLFPMKKMCYTYSRQKYPFPVDEKPGKDRIMRKIKRKRKTQNKKRQTARNEDFIMKPSVDWCFKELMRNPKTRKGFIAVLASGDFRHSESDKKRQSQSI